MDHLLLPQKYGSPSLSFGRLHAPFPLPGMLLFYTPGSVLFTSQFKCSFFGGAGFRGILDWVTHSCYMPTEAVIIWEVQIIVFDQSY